MDLKFIEMIGNCPRGPGSNPATFAFLCVSRKIFFFLKCRIHFKNFKHNCLICYNCLKSVLIIFVFKLLICHVFGGSMFVCLLLYMIWTISPLLKNNKKYLEQRILVVIPSYKVRI